ncbi:9480_t:CDS:2, partial [Diversispora eburnea]
MSNNYHSHNKRPISNNFVDKISSRETSLILSDEFSGLERICLTANGNLQRILRYEREVALVCENKVVCNAFSDVIVRDDKILNLIENEGVGLGQLFSYFDKVPLFRLLQVGRNDQNWWRVYNLEIIGVECEIKEVVLAAYLQMELLMYAEEVMVRSTSHIYYQLILRQEIAFFESAPLGQITNWMQ